MGFFIDIIQVSKINGVEGYIFSESQGDVIAHNIKNYQETGRMIASCGKHTLSVGKTRLRFVVFSRKNQKDLLIFPVGNYYLGVIKQKDAHITELTDNVLNFLTGLLDKHT